MCEFCNNPFGNRDAQHVEFAGFFTVDAIEAAVRQAAGQKQKRSKKGGGDASSDDAAASDEDSDGT